MAREDIKYVAFEKQYFRALMIRKDFRRQEGSPGRLERVGRRAAQTDGLVQRMSQLVQERNDDRSDLCTLPWIDPSFRKSQ